MSVLVSVPKLWSYIYFFAPVLSGLLGRGHAGEVGGGKGRGGQRGKWGRRGGGKGNNRGAEKREVGNGQERGIGKG